MPDDLDDGDRGALLDAFAVEALAIEENEIAERTFRDARAAYLDTGRPAKAAEMLVGVLEIWRREARPVGEQAALAAPLFEELDAAPADSVRGKLPGWLLDEWTRIHLDRMAIDTARSVIETMRETSTARGDSWLAIQAIELGAMADVLDGRVAEGLDAIWAAAHEAQRADFRDLGIAAFRDGATLAVRAMDYARAGRSLADGLRYADVIEQSHCRHVMGALSAIVAWAGADWDGAAATARQTIADHGSRRAVAAARWAIGYVALGRGDIETAEAELMAALSVGEESGAIDLILPPLWGLAEAALLADRPDQAAARCHDALERARGRQRALLVPFVVTGSAPSSCGRPADAGRGRGLCRAPREDAGPGPAGSSWQGLVALAAGATGGSQPWRLPSRDGRSGDGSGRPPGPASTSRAASPG
jgi:hypothetical protein